MDFVKLKEKFEPEETKYDWETLKSKFEPETEKKDWESLKAKFEPEAVTPQPITQVGANLGLPSGPQSTPEDKPILLKAQDTLKKVGYTAEVFGEAMLNIPKSIKASALQTQGWEGVSIVNPDKNDQYINQFQEEQAKVAKEAITKYGDMSFMGIKLSDVASMSQNIGYSVVSMAGGAAVAAPLTLVAGPLALVAGTVASGAVAFKMSTYQIMKSYLDIKNEENIKIRGKPITLEEEETLKKDFADKAGKYGLWEAIPEAISNFAFFSILTAPLTKMVGKTIAGKIVNKIGGMYGEELLTETITQIGQSTIQAEAGMGGEKRNILSGKDWWKSFKEVAPQTALLTTVMAGAGTSIIETSKAINKARVSLIKEIGVDNPLYNNLEKKVTEKIKSAGVEGVTPITGTGETKVRGLALSVESKAIADKLTEGFGDLPEYKTINMQDQADKVAKIINSDYELAKKMALGEKGVNIPPDILPESVFTGVRIKAEKEGDVKTIMELATSPVRTVEATTMGQRIKALDVRDPESPVFAIQDINKTLERAKGFDTKKVGNKMVTEVDNNIKKFSPNAKSWIDLMNSIRCP